MKFENTDPDHETRDVRTVKFFSPSPVLTWWNWIRSSLDPQNFWKSSVRSANIKSHRPILPHEAKELLELFCL